jgi:sorting nexin-9/18/33
LNRFHAFVTSGAEEFIVTGKPHEPPTVEHEDVLNQTVDVSILTSREEEEEVQTDHHFIQSGPSWKHKFPEFSIAVHDPEKRARMGGMQEYTVFHVTSTFDHDVSTTVERRFNQFQWLHTRLVVKFPSLVLAQLPEKQFTGRFHADFIEKRRRALERFINRLARHPVVRYSDLFTHFLSCTDEGEWNKRAKAFEQDTVVGPMFFERVFHPAFNVDDDGDVDSMRDLQSHVKGMSKLLGPVMESAQGYRHHLQETRQQLRKMAYGLLRMISGEEDSVVVNDQGAWCWRDDCHDCMSLTKALQSTSDSLHQVADVYNNHAHHAVTPWVESIQEYAHILPATQATVDMHLGAYHQHEQVASADDEDYDAARTKARCETVFNVALAEADRFHQEKNADFKGYATRLLDNEIAFHERILNELKQARARYDDDAYTKLATTPREASEHAMQLQDVPVPESPTPISSVVGGVVDGVGTVGTYLKQKATGTVRGTILDWGWA